MDVIQNPACFNASWKQGSLFTAPAGAFYQIADFEVEAVFKRFFLCLSFHLSTPCFQKPSQKTDFGSPLKSAGSTTSQGGRDIQTGGILQYFEDLNSVPNAEIGPKDFFEIASSLL